MPNEEMAAYRIRSLRRRSSATSSGGVAKRTSSATIRERRFSILFLTAIVPCICVR